MATAMAPTGANLHHCDADDLDGRTKPGVRVITPEPLRVMKLAPAAAPRPEWPGIDMDQAVPVDLVAAGLLEILDM
jgi:hypothetical protein